MYFLGAEGDSHLSSAMIRNDLVRQDKGGGDDGDNGADGGGGGDVNGGDGASEGGGGGGGEEGKCLEILCKLSQEGEQPSKHTWIGSFEDSNSLSCTHTWFSLRAGQGSGKSPRTTPFIETTSPLTNSPSVGVVIRISGGGNVADFATVRVAARSKTAVAPVAMEIDASLMYFENKGVEGRSRSEP